MVDDIIEPVSLAGDVHKGGRAVTPSPVASRVSRGELHRVHSFCWVVEECSQPYVAKPRDTVDMEPVWLEMLALFDSL